MKVQSRQSTFVHESSRVISIAVALRSTYFVHRESQCFPVEGPRSIVTWTEVSVFRLRCRLLCRPRHVTSDIPSSSVGVTGHQLSKILPLPCASQVLGYYMVAYTMFPASAAKDPLSIFVQHRVSNLEDSSSTQRRRSRMRGSHCYA